MTHDLDAARAHSSNHRSEVEASTLCGCFYCRRTFPPADVVEWVDDGTTALCPRCGIDSVIGDAAGYSLSEDFLQRMHVRWFGLD